MYIRTGVLKLVDLPLILFPMQKVILIAVVRVLTWGCFGQAVKPEYYNIGLMFPISTQNYAVSPGVKFMAAMEMAIDDINDKNDGLYDHLLPITELRMVVRSPLKTFARGAIAATEMIAADDGKGVIACAGPAALDAMKGSNPVFAETGDIPQIGYSDRGSILGDSRAFRNHLRTVPAYYDDGIVVADLLVDFFGWNKVAVFSTTDDYGSQTAFLFKHQAIKRGIQILSSHAFLVNSEDLTDEIRSAKKSGARVFVFLMQAHDAYNLLQQGHELGLFTRSTQIIGGDLLSSESYWTAAGLPDQKVSTFLSGFVGVRWKPRVFPSPEVTSFVQRWKSRNNTNGIVQPDGSVVCDDRMDYYNQFYLHRFQPYENASATPVCAGVNFSSYGDDGSDLVEEMYAYDAVMAIALALHEITYVQNVCEPYPSQVLDFLQHNLYFKGLTGNVSFSTEYDRQFFDIGGRATSYVYEVVNYVRGSSTPDGKGTVVFKQASEWHSEEGFVPCNGHTLYDKECHDFTFSTKDDVLVYDSPPPEYIKMESYYRAIMMIIALQCLALLCVVVAVVLVFRNRRICRMAQPGMIFMICIGLILGCIRVILAANDITTSTCVGEFWAAHLGFIVVVATLGVKTWRVYLVTNALKKMKVSEKKCVVIVLSIVSISAIIMTIHTVIGHFHVEQVVIVQDQFEYIKRPKCLATNNNARYVLYAVELMLIFFTSRMMWFTRHVASTISSTGTAATAVLNICSAILLMFIVLALVKLEPQVRQFFIGVVIAMICIRVTWILYSQLVINVLLGYDLDKALQLKKMAWSVLSVSLLSGAAKVMGLGGDESTTTLHSTHNTDESYTKAMTKFSKSKNAGELQYEIDKIKKEISERQAELACLENMKFASSNSANSSSSGQKNSSHADEPVYQSDKLKGNSPVVEVGSDSRNRGPGSTEIA